MEKFVRTLERSLLILYCPMVGGAVSVLSVNPEVGQKKALHDSPVARKNAAVFVISIFGH